MFMRGMRFGIRLLGRGLMLEEGGGVGWRWCSWVSFMLLLETCNVTILRTW